MAAQPAAVPGALLLPALPTFPPALRGHQATEELSGQHGGHAPTRAPLTAPRALGFQSRAGGVRLWEMGYRPASFQETLPHASPGLSCWPWLVHPGLQLQFPAVKHVKIKQGRWQPFADGSRTVSTEAQKKKEEPTEWRKWGMPI